MENKNKTNQVAGGKGSSRKGVRRGKQKAVKEPRRPGME